MAAMTASRMLARLAGPLPVRLVAVVDADYSSALVRAVDEILGTHSAVT
jgi:hypothetical protein